MKSIIIYHSNILHKGGIETFLFVFCKRLSKFYNITLLYDKSDITTLLAISNYVDCERYTKQNLSCDYLILASAWGTTPTATIKAKKVIQMIHADLRVYAENKMFTLRPDKKVTHYVTVSKVAHDSLKELHNIDAEVIYNLIDIETPIYQKTLPKDLIRIVTACRLSKEKGIERCIALSKLLPFDHVWDIYGSTPNPAYLTHLKTLAKGSKVVFHPFTDNPHKEYASAHWVAQLSDTEGFCYTVQEALYQKTPILATPYPSIKELQNQKNILIVDFQLKNINFAKITNPPKVEKYKEISSPETWVKFLES